MNKYIILFFLTGFFLITKCQEISIDDFKNIESICYCNTTESTPDAILKMDNNWEIVLSLLSPKSTSQLDSAGIRYTESQLRLLKEWSIITKSKDGIYNTNIPVFDSLKSAGLREYSYSLSKKLVKQIANDVTGIKNRLEKNRRGKNTYSILFSYVLDGMVWDYLDADSLLPSFAIDVKSPYWAGEYWLLYPKRGFSCGTNSINDKGYSIKVNWSEKAIPYMMPFVSRWDLLGKMLDDYIMNNKVEDKETIEVFSAYNLFDSDGYFTVPVIIENNNNELYKISGEISEKVKTFLTNEIDTDFLKKEFRFKSSGQAIIILYHEMLWDMLDIMESDGLITKPAVFTDPGNSEASDVSDLVIITKK